jgi:hypothetical protein
MRLGKETIAKEHRIAFAKLAREWARGAVEQLKNKVADGVKDVGVHGESCHW